MELSTKESIEKVFKYYNLKLRNCYLGLEYDSYDFIKNRKTLKIELTNKSL